MKNQVLKQQGRNHASLSSIPVFQCAGSDIQYGTTLHVAT